MSHYSGYIRLYIGPMFSGKTASLIEAYTRHEIGNRKCLLLKHTCDDRYSASDVVSHDGRHLASQVSCSMLCEVDHMVNEFQVVCIDEVQFFDDAPIFCDKWANQGIIVEASGLCGTYARSEFPVISQLIPLAEEVKKKSAVCRETGNNASFTKRTTNETELIVVGGSNKYKPVDRQTYFSELCGRTIFEHNLEEFKKFVKLYTIKKNICISNYDKLWEYFREKQNDKSYLKILQSFLEMVR